MSRYEKFFLKYQNKFKNQPKIKKYLEDKQKIQTALSFGFEWTTYAKIIEAFEQDWKRYFLPFINPQIIKNKTVADIGCGLAKHGYFMGKYGAKYIGIDLSEAVEAAYQNTKKFNSLIIQADIYNLPLKSTSIDFFYSIGVIHHLSDPKAGFLKIIDLMERNSKILIWVYGKEKNKRFNYIYNPLRLLTKRIPKNTLYKLCYIPAIITHLFNLVSIGLERIGAKELSRKVPFSYYSNFPFSFKVNDSFDVLATPKQVNYSKEEIEEWFKEGKLRKYLVVLDSITGIKGFGVK